MILCNNPKLQVPQALQDIWQGSHVMLLIDTHHLTTEKALVSFVNLASRSSGVAAVILTSSTPVTDLASLSEAEAYIAKYTKVHQIPTERDGGKTLLKVFPLNEQGWGKLVQQSKIWLNQFQLPL